jgi:hypothetical protein
VRPVHRDRKGHKDSKALKAHRDFRVRRDRKEPSERKVLRAHKELPDPAFLRVVQLGKR